MVGKIIARMDMISRRMVLRWTVTVSTCFRDMASCVSVFRTSLSATFDVLKVR